VGIRHLVDPAACRARHLAPCPAHWPLTYEPAVWSVVFPLGMYGVATLTFGKAAHLAFMEPLSRFMLWVALAAWLAVAAAFVARILGAGGFSLPGNHRGMTGRIEQDQPPEES